MSDAIKHLHDLGFYAEKFLKVVTKSGQLHPLRFNAYQKELARIIKEDEDAGRPVRLIVLKCRQIGGSTFGGAYNYHKTATRFYRKATVIAHDDDSTNNLFRMQKRFHDFCPEQIRPMKRYSNAKELVFENPDEGSRDENPGLLSSITVENANNLTAGRSGTIHHLHCSEVAFWKNAATVITGLFQAVPYEAGTSIIVESTANGISGHGEQFYRMCMDAMKGKSAYRFIFFKWTENPEYEIDPPEGFEATPEECELVKAHPELTPRKLAWRRYKIQNEMGSGIMDPADQFKQEYPLTPQEAFIASGRPVFNMDRLMRDIERARTLEFDRGEIVGGKMHLDPKGRLKIFKRPLINGRYTIGADVAEGLERGDYSTMTVLDKRLEQVASFHGHLHPDLFGAEMLKVGRAYYDALLAPEVNNHGLTTLTHLTNANYPNIFMREVLDERSNEFTKKAGWQTNFKTKTLMLDRFVAGYRDGLIKINDVELLEEMATLTLNPDGSVDLNGKDRVVSFCIALQAIDQVSSENAGAYEPVINGPKLKGFLLEDMLAYSDDNTGESYFD